MVMMSKTFRKNTVPQTLSNFDPQGKLGLNIGGDVFTERPGAAIWIAKLMALWSSNENLLGSVFCEALGAARMPAAAMYQALYSSSAQIDTATAAILTCFPEQEKKDILIATVNLLKKAKKERNKLAHWLYCYCYENHDFIVLIPPQHVLAHFHLNLSQAETNKMRSNAYIYDTSEFSQIYDQFELVQKCLQRLFSYFRDGDQLALDDLRSILSNSATLK